MRKKSIFILSILLLVSFMFIGCGNSNDAQSLIEKNNTSESQSIPEATKKTTDIIEGDIVNIKIKDVISGDGQNKLGEYGVAYYPDTLDDDDLIEIYNNQIKGQNLKWVTLINATTRNEGYLFSDLNSGIFTYGLIDKTDRMKKMEYMGQIIDNSVNIIKK
ncbi:hypothetical protein ACSXAY_18665 (plasmid) [Clostridium perfringens]